MPTIRVRLDALSYDITVGCRIVHKLALQLQRVTKGQRLFVVYDANFFALHGKSLSKVVRRFKNSVEIVTPSGERVKSAAELNRLRDFLLRERISRSDFILAVGGGVTSDLVGFAAATTLRGIRWGVVSTTLLGMVDAAIGGKTGINHPMGKNLVGAFWQPAFVWCDTQYLSTLPRREIVSGMGELLKYAGLIGDPMIKMIAQYLNKGLLIDEKRIVPLITRGARYKAEVVAEDERESGKRMVLNLGHTFAHGIENALGYGKLRHGEAVILGLLAASELSLMRKKRTSIDLGKYRELVREGVGLVPVRKVTREQIISAMSLDKKRIGRKLHFVLLEKPGKPIIVDAPPDREVRKSITAMLDYYAKHGGQRA